MSAIQGSVDGYGTFRDFLISSWGVEQYRQFYNMEDSRRGLYEIYGPAVIDNFVTWLRLFRLDEGVKDRIVELLN